MKMNCLLISAFGRVDPQRHTYDMLTHSSKARELEPWWRHKEKRKMQIPWYEKIIILAIAAGAILLVVLLAQYVF